MSYKVLLTRKAEKQLDKLDKPTRTTIINWIRTNLWQTDNPRQHGKALTGSLADLWRYRVGNYRILAEIHDDTIIIEIFKIEHRSSVYKIKR